MWARSDPSLGWTIDPGYRAGEINPQGFRDAKDFDTWRHHPESARLMLLGDSFVVGAHLSSEQTLPVVLKTRLGDSYDVFSLAVPGWGIDQMYLAYEHYKDTIRPDVVVLAFIDDDVRRGNIFKTMADDTKQRNGRVIVVRIPTRDDTDWVKQVRRRLGNWGASLADTDGIFIDAVVENVEGLGRIADPYVEDGHLSAVGTEQLASQVLGLIQGPR